MTIRKAGKILGRQVVRFALADDGTEYAILDRLYKTGELANYEAKKAVYEQVFARLLSMYNVAVCTTSAHDDDVASLVRDYVQLHTLQHIIPTSSIRTPKRKAGKIYCAYYHDSGTKTYKSKDGYIYDCLEKNSFYILTKIA